MSSTQRPPRRRSARHAFDEEDALPAKRTKMDTVNEVGATNGVGKQTNGRANGAAARKPKAAYDEDDDGFTFSRKTRSKKAAPTKPAPPQSSEDSAPAPEPAQPSKPARRTKRSLALPDHVVAEDAAPRRRSARLSGHDLPPAPQPATPAPEKPKRVRKTAKESKPSEENENDEMVGLVGQKPAAEKERASPKRIALPFADTPVIKRNKEMRKGGGGGHRRSSTGLRGRRASSLIDSGTSNAVPHEEVPIDDFYKHIEQSLPEPRRMKQLLTWCGTRVLPPKPSGDVKDSNAIMAARAIQQELLNDFATRSEMSDWFSREDAAPTVLVKKPNPRNEQMAAKVEELEQEVKRLQQERRAWEKLLKSHSPPSLTDFTFTAPSASASASTTAPSHTPQPPPDLNTPTISPDLLDDPTQLAIFSTLSISDPAAEPSTAPPRVQTSDIQYRIQQITTSLEPNIDIFAGGVHTVEQYRAAAERVADRVLGAAADRLEERERETREKSGTAGVGTGDVLRALGGALNGR
ncbi:hypothetical protein K490DRAFT_56609 [Saccharata proteae CBS 121410]|uniref:Uncharacterized protein n=1 Tax=Saccharata proteae CBS 121410 TaxID=1314787 RepID=A0A9P4HU18_9PEZI|nr:hypothetical protein K490DRAFT_56609 [Saccharata proteae CBS 121410]